MSEEREDFNPLKAPWTLEHDNLRHWCSLGLNVKDVITRLKPLSKILDVGMGQGEHAVMLGAYDHYVYTLDIDPKNNPDFVHDLRRPLSRSFYGRYEFDAITCHHTLEHLEFEFFAPRIVDFYELLKPGGFLFLTLPCRSRPFSYSLRFARWESSRTTRQLKKFTTSAFHYWEISKQTPPTDILNVLDFAGFVNVEMLQSHYNPFEYRFIAQKEEVKK